MPRSANPDRQKCLPDPALLPDFLRGKFPLNTAKEVSRALGAPVGTVENWLAGKATPGFVMSLAMVGLWPDFLASVFRAPPGWAVAAARAERASRLEGEIAARRAELEGMRA